MAILLKEVTVSTRASKETIWKIWADVEKWPHWDDELEWVKIFGPFQLGTRGELKPKGAPKVKTVITECTYLKSFTDQSKLPLAILEFTHEMQEKDGLCWITVRIIFRGLLGWFFAKVMGKNLAKGLEHQLKKMIALAETNEKR
jgi:hypothetical protein